MISSNDTIKMIDFGLSKSGRIKKDNWSAIAGTPFYMAPEVLNMKYGTKADMWSLGVLLYVMVSGYLPFQGGDNIDVFNSIRYADYHFDHDEFKNVSHECKDLIKKLLVVDSKKRLDSTQAMKHKWFKLQAKGKTGISNIDNLDDEVIQRLLHHKGESLFKRAALNMLIKMASDKDV